MADSRNQPELETLSYAPECKCEICEEAKQKILKTEPIPPANIGFNSAVIKPERRVNKSGVAGQHLQESLYRESELEMGDYKPPPCALPDKNGGVLANPEQHFKAPHKTNIGTKDKSDYRAVEQPNQNLMIIKEIEGLMSQVNEKIEDLDVGLFGAVSIDYDVSGKMNERDKAKNQALEGIDIFQKTTLFELRKAFE